MGESKFELQMFCTPQNLIRSTYYSDTYRATFEMDGVTKAWDINHISLPFADKKEAELLARFGIEKKDAFAFYKQFAKCVQNGMNVAKYINDIPLSDPPEEEGQTAKPDPAAAVKNSAALCKFRRVLAKTEQHGSDVYLVTEPLEPFVGSEFCDGNTIMLDNLLSFAARAAQILNGFSAFGFHIGAIDLDTVFFQNIDGRKFFAFGSFLYAGFDADRAPSNISTPWPNVVGLPTLPANADESVKNGGPPSLVTDMHSLVGLLWTMLSGKNYRLAPDYSEKPRYAPDDLAELLLMAKDSEDPNTLKLLSKKCHALMRNIKREELPNPVIHMMRASPQVQVAPRLIHESPEPEGSHENEPEDDEKQETPPQDASAEANPVSPEPSSSTVEDTHDSDMTDSPAAVVAEVIPITAPITEAEEPPQASAEDRQPQTTPEEDRPPQGPAEAQQAQPPEEERQSQAPVEDRKSVEETRTNAEPVQEPAEAAKERDDADVSTDPVQVTETSQRPPEKPSELPQNEHEAEAQRPTPTAQPSRSEPREEEAQKKEGMAAPPVMPVIGVPQGGAPGYPPGAYFYPVGVPVPYGQPAPGQPGLFQLYPQMMAPQMPNIPKEDTASQEGNQNTTQNVPSQKKPIAVQQTGKQKGQKKKQSAHNTQRKDARLEKPAANTTHQAGMKPSASSLDDAAEGNQTAEKATARPGPSGKPTRKIVRRTVTTYQKPRKRNPVATVFLLIVLISILGFLGAGVLQYMGYDVPYDIPLVDELAGKAAFTVSPESISMSVGEEVVLVSSAGCTLNSSDHSIAVVSDTGHVRAIGPGTCTITARASGSSAVIRIPVQVYE